jgi:hypothetical protein
MEKYVDSTKSKSLRLGAFQVYSSQASTQRTGRSCCLPRRRCCRTSLQEHLECSSVGSLESSGKQRAKAPGLFRMLCAPSFNLWSTQTPLLDGVVALAHYSMVLEALGRTGGHVSRVRVGKGSVSDGVVGKGSCISRTS